jgi:tetratricopeptide (TPR) repeat protein
MRSGAFHAMQGTRDPARGQSYSFAEDCLSKDTLEDGSLQGQFHPAPLPAKPDFAAAYYNLGYAYSPLSRTNEAIGAYKKAIELKPDFVEAYFNLGQYT